MRKLIIAAAALAFVPFAALAEGPSEEQMAKIDEVLAAKSCEVDPANVEVEDGAFDLDDVMCADGQYDIKLDASYAVTEERKE
ncbi:PepSY domain-containing protein [Amaricoccus sp.]|uniref:PepSY domain-containing protein n=1 Tax=Amaricoccus sp. TaxID=1872485 RepID=UPI002637BE6A|nr:PepSY domain-containing protein [Amaricoccus sp.]HRO12468.1 PepSY domain-containing protein [Amaricoccus sp.]